VTFAVYQIVPGGVSSHGWLQTSDQLNTFGPAETSWSTDDILYAECTRGVWEKLTGFPLGVVQIDAIDTLADVEIVVCGGAL